MRHEADFFADQELILVYMARRLKEALRLEEVFDAANLDYVVEPKPYQSGLLFPFERVGAFFYVESQMEMRALNLLREHGFKAYKKPVG